YSGLFRLGIKRLDVVNIQDPEAHYCVLYLEVAWEPRFQPFFLETQADSIEAKDDKGNPVAGDVPQDTNNGSGRAAVGRRNAMELEIRVPAPRRSVQQFGQLKGTINVVGPTKMLTFAFDKLSKIEKKAQIRRAEQDGVNVLLRKFLIEGENDDPLWTAELQLDYPPDGPKFESFQSWIVNNEVYLEKGNERFPSNG